MEEEYNDDYEQNENKNPYMDKAIPLTANPTPTSFTGMGNTPVFTQIPVAAFEPSFSGVPGCPECNGSGFTIHKGKKKHCKSCMKELNYCPKCNNTGNLEDGSLCDCRETY